jgi:1,4-alpha-glucan branching enzyme
MPGDEWQNCKFKIAIWLYVYASWNKIIVYVDEQSAEWNFEGSLDWHLNEYPYHEGQKKLITDLNSLYKTSLLI